MNLSADTVYEHAEYGEILVLGVDHIFTDYDPETGDGTLKTKIVRYATEWDDYGPMPSAITADPLETIKDDFQTVIRTVEFEDTTRN